MATTLGIGISGPIESARALATAIAAMPSQDERGVSITWSHPHMVPGISQSTFELLGTIGVLSFPLSFAASILANLITNRLAEARRKAASHHPENETARDIRVSVSIVDMNKGKITRIEITNVDSVDRTAIERALLDQDSAD
jgi:hypothetical protein